MMTTSRWNRIYGVTQLLETKCSDMIEKFTESFKVSRSKNVGLQTTYYSIHDTATPSSSRTRSCSSIPMRSRTCSTSRRSSKPNAISSSSRGVAHHLARSSRCVTASSAAISGRSSTHRHWKVEYRTYSSQIQLSSLARLHQVVSVSNLMWLEK